MSKKKKIEIREKRETYERLGVVEIEDVSPEKENDVFLGENVKLSSLRMRTFLTKGTVCSSCGLSAKFFAVERHIRANHQKYHLNLYGINDEGNEILFTHDHTLARSLGGKDHINNTTTMCTVCNGIKAIKEREPKEKLVKGD